MQISHKSGVSYVPSTSPLRSRMYGAKRAIAPVCSAGMGVSKNEAKKHSKRRRHSERRKKSVTVKQTSFLETIIIHIFGQMEMGFLIMNLDIDGSSHVQVR